MSRNILAALGISQHSKQALRNPWVLGMAGFIFLVIAVNAGFIMTAMHTNPGLVDKNYYDRGRAYERNVLKQIAARNALGLQARFEAPVHIVITKPAVFQFAVVDKLGLPLTDSAVTVTAYRPSDASADFSVAMRHLSSGRYQAELSFPLKGVWDLIIKLKHGEDLIEFTHRISVHQT